jgi:hypothetical protein
MNDGIGHEAGETARSVVKSLQSTPVVLALVLFNLVFMGVVAYVTYMNSERWQSVVESVLKQCGAHQ